jgi:proteic killer suppression protein
MVNIVSISDTALKQLRKLPIHIVDKLYLWKRSVEDVGLEHVRKIPGYNDEKLVGRRLGQRSIRLNRGYRAIYEVLSDGRISFVEIVEVNKHEY